jgi:2'-deoxynucleoside 5'-phosphate N-hydrolase
MRVYLSVPISVNKCPERTKLIADVLVEAGHDLISEWVLDEIEVQPDENTNIYYRDIFAVQTSDLLVADVTTPSTGVGMEIMAAYLAGKKIVLVKNKESALSRMLVDMESADWIEYEDDESLVLKLESYFAKPLRKKFREDLLHAPGVSLR